MGKGKGLPSFSSSTAGYAHVRRETATSDTMDNEIAGIAQGARGLGGTYESPPVSPSASPVAASAGNAGAGMGTVARLRSPAVLLHAERDGEGAAGGGGT